MIQSRTYKTTPENLLIVMGGADEFNFTQKVVDILVENRVDLKINIVLGSGHEYREGLEQSLASSSVNYKIKENVTNMFEQYMNCDVAIGTGGLTSYELIATRTPALLIAVYEHQVERCKYFDAKGYAKYLGFRNFESRSLVEGITKHPKTSISGYNVMVREVVKSVSELVERY